MKLDDLEMKMLAEACGFLHKIANRPDPGPPKVHVAASVIPAPVVNVPAPVVHVAAPEIPPYPKPFSEWKFTITNAKGEVKTIIATAIK